MPTPTPTLSSSLVSSVALGLCALSLSACPMPPATTDVTTTDAGSTGSSSAGTDDTTGGDSSSSTTAEEMTSEGPTDATEGATETTGPASSCGDGVLDEGEECDEGGDNSETGACTPLCTNATCGDGYVWSGQEECDDGADNGEYGYCLDDCSGPGPRCGDGVVQQEFDEECDTVPPAPHKDGCIPQSCTVAESCEQLAQFLPEELKVSGPYSIHPEGSEALLTKGVWCDFENGWTFLKYDSGGQVYPAQDANEICTDMGLTLFWPDSPEHLEAAIAVAMNEDMPPAGNGDTKADIGYLGILAIYPAAEGESCLGAPLNSQDCPEWKVPGGHDYFVGAAGFMDQPSTFNCAGCSMEYLFDAETMTIDSYFAFINSGVGATRANWMCRAGPS